MSLQHLSIFLIYHLIDIFVSDTFFRQNSSFIFLKNEALRSEWLNKRLIKNLDKCCKLIQNTEKNKCFINIHWNEN